MSQSATAGLILAAAALVLYLTGRAVRNGAVWLVAGYRPDRVHDPASREALARHVGGFCLLLAAAAGAAAVATLAGARGPAVGRWLGVAVAAAFVLLLAREARRSLR